MEKGAFMMGGSPPTLQQESPFVHSGDPNQKGAQGLILPLSNFKTEGKNAEKGLLEE